jgi:hypothetical protein
VRRALPLPKRQCPTGTELERQVGEISFALFDSLTRTQKQELELVLNVPPADSIIFAAPRSNDVDYALYSGTIPLRLVPIAI